MPATFPTIDGKTLIEKMAIRLKSSTVTMTSPFTFDQQTQDFGGRRWEAEVTIRLLTHTEALQFDAFLTGLNGVTGTFYLGNPLMTQSASTNVTINGAQSAGDTTVAVTSANTGAAVPAGHHIEIGGHLHMTLTEIPKNANTTITIVPGLREDVADNDAVTVNQPSGTWRLADPEIEYDISTAGSYSFTFACIEAI
jgi:hypothetical protein